MSDSVTNTISFPAKKYEGIARANKAQPSAEKWLEGQTGHYHNIAGDPRAFKSIIA